MKKNIEPITWECFRPMPGGFLCDVCHKTDATHFAVINMGGAWASAGIEPRIPVCARCAELSAEAIVGPFLNS